MLYYILRPPPPLLPVTPISPLAHPHSPHSLVVGTPCITPLAPSCSHLTPFPHRGGGDPLPCSPCSHLTPCPHRGGGDPLSYSLSLPSLPLTHILPLAPTEMVWILLTYFDHWEQEEQDKSKGSKTGVRGSKESKTGVRGSKTGVRGVRQE